MTTLGAFVTPAHVFKDHSFKVVRVCHHISAKVTRPWVRQTPVSSPTQPGFAGTFPASRPPSGFREDAKRRLCLQEDFPAEAGLGSEDKPCASRPAGMRLLRGLAWKGQAWVLGLGRQDAWCVLELRVAEAQ